MRTSLEKSRSLRLQSHSHAGLWYDCFFNEYDRDWSVPKDGKLKWVKTVVGKVGDNAALNAFTRRQRVLLSELGGVSKVFSTAWHFVTGLGNDHPVENGFAWHHTLGAPYLTGAAVKGLLRAWCDQWAEKDEKTIKRWFGDEDNHISGNLIFLDALPICAVELKADVMTPHYNKWYEEGNIDPKPNGSNVPADWHDPVPVPFLVVAPGQSFQFSIAKRCVPEAEEIDLDSVMNELEAALQHIGAGAKTAVGYGRMAANEKENKRIETENDQREREKRRRIMSPEELIVDDIRCLSRDKLSTLLGSQRNRTKKEYQDMWGGFLEKMREIHGDTIRRWKNSDKKNERKAYRTVFSDD